MIKFAITMLVLILIGLTHAHNWIIRVVKGGPDQFIATFLTTIAYIAAIILLLNFIIKWGSLII